MRLLIIVLYILGLVANHLNFYSFITEEALSSELAGYFFLDINEKDKALEYFMQAHEKYHEWGAIAKSNAVFEFVQASCGSGISYDPAAAAAPIHNGQGSNDAKHQRKRGTDRWS